MERILWGLGIKLLLMIAVCEAVPRGYRYDAFASVVLNRHKRDTAETCGQYCMSGKCINPPVRCNSCRDDETFSEDGSTCLPCPVNCKECSPNPDAVNNELKPTICKECDVYFRLSDTDNSVCEPCAVDGNVHTCTECEEEGANKCDVGTCVDGYAYSEEEKLCLTCADFCHKCESPATCTDGECFEGYIYDNTTSDCRQCADGCRICEMTGSTKCDVNSCFPGYAYKEERCDGCPSHCHNCTYKGDILNCDNCQTGYVTNPTTGQCEECPSNCDECEYNMAESKPACKLCNAYWTVNSDTHECERCQFTQSLTLNVITRYCSLCNENGPGKCDQGDTDNPCEVSGYAYNTVDKTCQSCPAYCSECRYSSSLDAIVCLEDKCAATFGYNADSGTCTRCIDNCLHCAVGGTCSTGQCALGYSLVENTCVQCSVGCEECTEANTCISCQTGYAFVPNEDDSGFGVCQSCPKRCDICEWDSEEQRTECKVCAERNALFGQDVGTCDACPMKCSACTISDTGKIFCLTDSCTDGYVYNVLDGTCIACVDNCFTCQQLSNSVGEAVCSICDAGYARSSDGMCIECPDNCNRCNYNSLTEKTMCQECNTPYKLDSTSGQCVSCPENCIFTSCTISAGVTSCSSCVTGYTDQNGQCAPCGSNCAACDFIDGKIKCNTGECDSGYALSSEGTCDKCDTGCTRCHYEDTTKICDNCDTGYSDDSFGGCLQCPANCWECSQLPGESVLCNKQGCKEGFYYVDSNMASGALTEGSCQPCSTGCASCRNSDECDVCYPTYAPNPVAGVLPHCGLCDECVDNECTWAAGADAPVCAECNVGYGKDNDEECKECAGGCATCSPESASSNIMSSCDSCKPGYHMITTDDACIICPEGCSSCTMDTSQGTVTCNGCMTGYVASGNLCLNCGPNCDTCSLNAASTTISCDTCATGYVEDSDGMCTECADGYGTQNGMCKSCPTNCDVCTTASVCTTCATGYAVDDVGGCTDCRPDNCESCVADTPTTCDTCSERHALTGTGACVECSTTCQHCNAVGETAGDCIDFQCREGYIMAANKQCVSCGSGCAFCKLATHTAAGDCVSCKRGYVLGDDNNCHQCPTGCTFCSLDQNGDTICQENRCEDEEIYDATAGCIVCDDACDGCDGTAATNCVSCAANYYDDGAGTCTACNAACNGCTSGEANACTTCAENYYNVAGTCTACNAACNGCTGADATTCTTCAENHYDAAGTCTACDDACDGCTGTAATDCIQCADGYADISGTCTACATATSDANCEECTSDGTSATCTSCATTFGLDATGSCINCQANCDKCNLDTTKCDPDGCADTFGWRIDGTCAATLCDFYDIDTAACLTLDGCSYVMDDGELTAVCPGELYCKAGYVWDGAACTACHATLTIGNCYTAPDNTQVSLTSGCSKGYTWIAGGTCQQCSENCMSCDSRGAGKCDNDLCNPGYFLNTQSGAYTCEECGANCDECQESSTLGTMECTDCATGYIIDNNGNCQLCPTTSGCVCQGADNSATCASCASDAYLDETDNLCYDCPVYCATCSYSVNGPVCDTCASNTHQHGSAPSCYKCFEGCTECSYDGNSGKLECGSGQCDTGYTQTESGSCFDCGTSCGICSLDEHELMAECSSCDAGTMYNNVDNTCDGCVAGCMAGQCQSSIVCNVDKCQPGYTRDSAGDCHACQNCDECTWVNGAAKCYGPCKLHYFKDSDGDCSVCPDNCDFCDNSATCRDQGCKPGYSIDDSYNCQSCDQSPGCVDCTVIDGSIHCYECSNEYFLSDGACKPCASNCHGCSQENKCNSNSCDDGYAYNPTDKTCLQCPSFCNRCQVVDGVSVCQEDECADGYGPSDPNVLGTCGQCAANCDVCDTNGAGKCDTCTTCHACSGSFESYCFADFGLSTEFTCGACASNCESCSCSGANKCDTCVDGYARDTNTATCFICPSNCEVCQYVIPAGETTGVTQCSTCNDGFVLNPTDKTCEPCPSNCYECTFNTLSETDSAEPITKCNSYACNARSVYRASDGACPACPSNCGVCVVNATTGKTMCKDTGCHTSLSRPCCDETYGLVTADLTCAKCPIDCLFCDDAGDGSMVCVQCESGFTSNAEECRPCTDNCVSCAKSGYNSQVCYTCDESPHDWVLSNGETCEPCVDKCAACEESAGGQVVCMAGQCDDHYAKNSAGNCQACNSLAYTGCSMCDDVDASGVSKCTECSLGYTFNENKTACVECPSSCPNTCSDHLFACNECTDDKKFNKYRTDCGFYCHHCEGDGCLPESEAFNQTEVFCTTSCFATNTTSSNGNSVYAKGCSDQSCSSMCRDIQDGAFRECKSCCKDDLCNNQYESHATRVLENAALVFFCLLTSVYALNKEDNM